MNELRYNRLLIPVLTVAVLVGTAANTLLQKLIVASYSFLSIAFIFVLSLLMQIGLVSIVWAVASRWPMIGGAIMLILFPAISLASFRASVNGSFPDDPVLQALLLIMTALYVVAGVMLLFSKKVVKDEAASHAEQ